MKRLQDGTAKRLLFLLLAASSLAGCAVYEPAYPSYPAYSSGTGYYDPYPADSSRMYNPPPAGYTASPTATYVAPPVYVQPPLFFNFGFWGRHGHHHGGGHHGFHSGGGGWRGHHR